jgi:hypothetical protein
MPGPFPGMDPYLEDRAHWPEFHKVLVAALYQAMLPGLVDRYRARVCVREYAATTALFTSVTTERHREESVEVRARDDGRLVTLVEVVSLGNRTTPEGRDAYLAARAKAAGARAAIVEIDLLTQGRPLLDYARDTLPPHDHTVTVTRGGTPDRYEIYTAALSKRLPRFRLPLAADDKDTIFDLQSAVHRAYDLGDFGVALAGIYGGPLPPDVVLSQETRDWVAAHLAPRPTRGS